LQATRIREAEGDLSQADLSVALDFRSSTNRDQLAIAFGKPPIEFVGYDCLVDPTDL
jgi:hypothetical protein